MTNLYVISWTSGVGKTALCVGIGMHLKHHNKKVGYFKPLVPATGIDKDAQFTHQVLGLEEPVEALCPFHFTTEALTAEDFPTKLIKAYSTVAKDKDVVLLEGLGGVVDDKHLQASCQIANILDAKVVILVPYSTDLPWKRITSCAGKFAQHLLGVVINRVPERMIESIHTEIFPLFHKEGMKVLGVLPEERLLLGISVAELAEHLHAEVLCCPEASSELVENLMIGALSVDPGVDYFARKANKAVITRGERPDIQLAALATSTKCLILGGGIAPIPQVLHWAEDKGTPILSVKEDTLSTVAKIEEAFLQARFRQQEKQGKLAQILEQHFDFATLYQSLTVIAFFSPKIDNAFHGG
jgi:BioD-like phosphotransacetylase family protein